MSKYYTMKQAMALLGLKGIEAFLMLERKHPEMFVNMNLGPDREKHPRYSKAALNKLYQMRTQSKDKS
jgi:hypothetical protein